MKYVSNSTKETAKIAKEFAEKVFNTKNKEAVVIGLSGDLGAGKTTFTKSFAKALGVKETVKSPTFNIMKKYPLHITRYALFVHIDAYRLNSAKEILDLGWKDLINDKKNIIIVEWAENIKKAFPKCNFWVTIRHIKERGRLLDIELLK
jgi:tRNA threonylcarbamoyladenosine biosynthesis protein TsaE